MKQALKRYIRGRILGAHMADEIPPDISSEDADMIHWVWPKYTLTSPDRIYNLIQSVRHLEANNVPGAFVECGVWRGGSMMAMAYALLAYDKLRPFCMGATRNLWLYDTYDGMSVPTARDRDYKGRLAKEMLDAASKEGRGIWCFASMPDVLYNMRLTHYPMSRMHFIEGTVEETIPLMVPDQIALLRLDTDWYESTKHELVHLYPRVASGGHVIIDDYGHWKGSKQATDEFLDTLSPRPYLHRLDYSARLLVKP